MKLPSFFLRIGLAFSFSYVAIDSAINPDAWIGFFPAPIKSLVSGHILLFVFGALELLLAIWLISGQYVFWSAIFSAVLLLGIIITNIGAFEIIFRDVTIFFAALGLAAMERKNLTP